MSHPQQVFQLSGATVSSILNRESKKQSEAPRNHQVEYIQQLRQMQRENRVRKERERYEEDKKEFKLKQFSQVKSKVDVKAPIVLSENKENAIQKDFSKIQKEKLKEASEKNAQSKVKDTPSIVKPAVPKHDDIMDLKPREERNFLSENSKTQIQTKVSMTKKSVDKPKHKDFGKVPEYIQRFNNARQEERNMQKRLAEEKRDCPPGMRLLPEEERLETVRCLEENKNAINAQLTRFPIVVDTIGLKRKKGQLEQRLHEIEDALKLFSRPKVFVTE